jgi:hypothetical protein
MKIAKKITLTFVTACLAASCTTNPVNLKPITSESSLSLKSPFEFTVDRSSVACKYLYKYVLSTGDYVSKFQDQEGIYYVGQIRNVREQQLVASCSNGTLGSFDADGGFFLPNDKQKPAKIFYFLKSRATIPSEQAASQALLDPKQRAYSAVALVAIAMEEGNIWFPPQPTEPSLRKALGQ